MGIHHLMFWLTFTTRNNSFIFRNQFLTIINIIINII